MGRRGKARAVLRWLSSQCSWGPRGTPRDVVDSELRGTPVELVGGPVALPNPLPQDGGAPNQAYPGSPISLHIAFHGTHGPISYETHCYCRNPGGKESSAAQPRLSVSYVRCVSGWFKNVRLESVKYCALREKFILLLGHPHVKTVVFFF